MAQCYIDTYMIVLFAIEDICGKRIIVKRKNLIKELHTSIKDLHKRRVVKHLHSCLEEILGTALMRFEQMEVIEVRSYSNKNGNETSFLLSHKEMSTLISDTLRFFSSVRQLS